MQIRQTPLVHQQVTIMAMNDALRETAKALLHSAPASVEIPAGTGKTHLLAAAVAIAGENEGRSLILTHTHAGVDAIRKRLADFGVRPEMFRVETISSWAYSLAGAYSDIAEIEVEEVPDWSNSREYVSGATKVASSTALQYVHHVSFDYLFIDEYQDCTVDQHEFIRSVAASVPKTIVFGDRLQAIFGFGDNVLITWETHVLPEFPTFEVESVPHRWKGHNEDLGDWLLQLRPNLVVGRTFDLAGLSITGLTHVSDTSPRSVAAVAHSFRDFDESVVLIDKWPDDVASHASRLGGSYSVMEDINGNFMRDLLTGNSRSRIMALPSEGEPSLALWFAQFAKACIVGLGNIDNPVLVKLQNDQSLGRLSRVGLESVLDALEQLRVNPTYEQLAIAAAVVRSVSSLKIFRWEAWNHTLESIRLSIENGKPPIENLRSIRERLRRTGRTGHNRIASRTLLIKGLEYDHVIIANLDKITDRRNLYVALSRARKTITIIGSRSSIVLTDD